MRYALYLNYQNNLTTSENEMSIERKILEWMATSNTGTSSKAMAFCAAGLKNNSPFCNGYPSDPSDFNRCLKLLDKVPEIRNHFDEISKLSAVWKATIDNWDKIESTFLNECGFNWSKKTTKATETYRLMKKIQANASR